MLDYETLIQPFDGDNPCGPDLRGDPEFRDIEDAPGDFANQKPQELIQLIQRCDVFLQRTKDQAPALVALQAAVRVGDFALANAALALVKGYAALFWEAFHPGPADEMVVARINELSALARPAALTLPLQRAAIAKMPSPAQQGFTPAMIAQSCGPTAEWSPEDEAALAAQVESGKISATQARTVRPNRDGGRTLRMILRALSADARAADAEAGVGGDDTGIAPEALQRLALIARTGEASRGLPKPAIAAGVAAVLALAGGGTWFATRGDDPPTTIPAGPVAANTVAVPHAPAPQGNPAERARAAVAAALPSIDCSWLDLATGADRGNAMTVKLTGVAGRPAEAQAAITRVAERSGAALDAADFSDVAPISASECGSVDIFRAIRSVGASHLTVPQRTFEVAKLPPESSYAGQIGARTIINLDLSGIKDFALYGLEPSGTISPLVPDRRTFDAMPKPGEPIADLGKGRYRFSIDANHTGWSGILLLTGKSGFSDALVAGAAGSHGPGWSQRFATAARAGDWRAEMVWFKMVDEVPN
ncbi:type VI secretion system ImpA family N-terminal domain-containing protein [Sphingomonas sp. LB2R24]|uniref:type VI secretion system ImpA family N-terminal domain-containing protein n=1 Tax=Sphingomonas sorbitolis TaxID=3096165 RepID=UPI002FCBE311